jgi:hypothetical protein
MNDGPLLKEARAQLELEGFRVGPDRLQRFRCFGIRSKRVGRDYHLEPQMLDDLRYVLSIERAFQLDRDHDCLSLELAYRAYHTIPWERVHRGARKNVADAMAKVDRILHRANNWTDVGFDKDRIPHLARQLARHYIPNYKIKQDPSNGLARNLIRIVAGMFLRATYHDEPFAERDVLRLLYMLGASDPGAMNIASRYTPMLNTVYPLFRLTIRNPFQAVLQTEPPAEGVQAAVQTMRRFPQMVQSMSAAGIPATVPLIVDYPNFEAAGSTFKRVDSALHSLSYAAACFFNSNMGTRATLERYFAGDLPAVDTAIKEVGTIVQFIPQAIKVQHGTN